jgi:hypothetical protein
MALSMACSARRKAVQVVPDEQDQDDDN